MKLSEIKGTRNLEIIADIIEPLGKIAMDDRYKGIFPLNPAKDESPQTTVMPGRVAPCSGPITCTMP